MTKIGLIAGSGRFPILFAQEAKKQGIRIVAVAVKGDTAGCINRYADRTIWVRISEFNKIVNVFKNEQIDKAVMAGQINPRRLFDKKNDFGLELNKLLSNIKDKKADTIFGAIADFLKTEGIELINSLSFLSNHLPKKGILTKRSPTESEWQDINFGLDLAKQIAGLDIGQTIVVKQKAILAVEALEGTDIAILRGGIIGQGYAVVVKVSKPQQDMRFDVPVIGARTVRTLIKAKISCLAIEAGRTLVLDREKLVRLANKTGIAIAAV